MLHGPDRGSDQGDTQESNDENTNGATHISKDAAQISCHEITNEQGGENTERSIVRNARENELNVISNFNVIHGDHAAAGQLYVLIVLFYEDFDYLLFFILENN